MKDVVRTIAGWWGREEARQDAETLVRSLRPEVYRIALSITASADAAEDATQEACYRLAKSAGKISQVENRTAWVRKVTVRCALDTLGRQAQGDALPDELIARTADPSEAIAVAATLRRLTPEHRAILALAIDQGLSYGEIAEALGIPAGSVASRLHYAKESFRKLWEEES